MNDETYWNNDAFCPMPWTSIYVEPNGKTDSCCIAKNKLGNIKESHIFDIVSGDKNTDIRKQMLAGTRVDGCARCYPHKTLNPDKSVIEEESFLRYHKLRTFENLDKTIYDTPDKFELRFADLRFRNTCNYACVYCSAELSSLWAAEQKVFQISDDAAIADLIKYFCDNAHTLDNVYLAGGEPLLIKENEILLDRLLEVNPECKLLVNTNLSMIENNRIFNLLLKFKNVRWLISAEDMHDRYEYIRYPGSWDKFNSNLQLLKNIVPSTHDIAFNMVYLALNAKTFFDWFDYILSLGFDRKIMSISYIGGGQSHTPLDPRMLPKSYKEEAIQLAKKYVAEDRIGTDLQFVINSLSMETKPTQDLFIELAKIDARRNLDSQKTFSDIYAARQ